MGKKLVDVEDLVVWAASELSRKRPDSNIVHLPVFDVGRANRELVGKWSRPMGYPSMSPMFSAGVARQGGARGEPPHEDALVVEAAIERLKLISPACRYESGELSFEIGAPVDAEGALAAALGNAANLLLVHGRLVNRPLLRFEPPEPEPKLAANGKPGVWRRERWAEPTFGDRADSERGVETPCVATRKGVYPSGAYGIVEWSPDPQTIVNERAEYAAWITALEWLATALSGKLQTRTALAPGAAQRPWMGDQDGAPIRDLFGLGAEEVYSGVSSETLAAERAKPQRRPIGGGNVYRGRAIKPAKGMREA